MVSTGRIRIGIVGAGGYGRSARGNLRQVRYVNAIEALRSER